MGFGDDELEIEGTASWKKGCISDHTKVKAHDGVIDFILLQQDGTKQSMTCKDTPANRMYVSYIQIHDRYTPRKTA